MTPEERERNWRDPTNWRWGFIYKNPDDPRVVVPKRFWKGGGWTLNVAHPGRAAAMLSVSIAIAIVPFFIARALGFRSVLATLVVLGFSIAVLVLISHRMAKG